VSLKKNNNEKAEKYYTKENSTELQKSNIEAEVYNKKNVTE